MPPDLQTPVSSGLRRSAVIGAMVFLAFFGVMPAGAQDLDPDSPPPAMDYVSCGHFESQESAQAALDSGNLDANGRQALDGDGDGIACEVRWGEPAAAPASPRATVTTLPGTGSGTAEKAENGNAPAAGSLLAGGMMVLAGRRLARR